MNWEAGANCFLLKAVHNYGKDWNRVFESLKTIAHTFLKDENLQDLSKQNCSLQYNYLIASTRQKYPTESDESKLLQLAMDFYAALRREKLHATRLELLKRIKIAEDDSEKLREGRFSEIPSDRLMIYRKRCRAFGLRDIIGQRLGLAPLSPGTDQENEAIRNGLTIPKIFDSAVSEEITDRRGGSWFPLRTSFRDFYFDGQKHNWHYSIQEFLRAQAILSQNIGLEQPDEDDSSSVDTSSSVKTHPDTHDCDVPSSRRAYRRPAVPSDAALQVERDEQPIVPGDHSTSPHKQPPTSPTSSALVSDSDLLISPLLEPSLNSSPSLSATDTLSPASRKRGRKWPNVPSTKTSSTRETYTALSPLTSEGGPAEEQVTGTAVSTLTLARRWRRALLTALSTIFNHRHAYVFMQPVTEDIAPGYGSVVLEPVDLTSIRRRLEAALSTLSSSTQPPPTDPKEVFIHAALGFMRDLMLMFVNARMYNNRNHEVYGMAAEMFRDCMVELQPLWSILVEEIPGFPALPGGILPPTKEHSSRTSLRPAVSKTTSFASPIANPVNAPTLRLRTPNQTKNLKRPAPETPPSTGPIRKRRQSSDGDTVSTLKSY